MALQKQPVEIAFAKGLDNKTDPFHIPIDNFTTLNNSVFDKVGRLTKRNGYGKLTLLPQFANFLTTFNDNLLAAGISTRLQAYSQGSNTWVDKGSLTPLELSTSTLIRSNTTQVQCDAVVSDNGMVCTVYTDTGSGSTLYKYAVADSETGQNIIPPQEIPSNGSIAFSPRVFFLGSYFIIVFATASKLEYVAINSLSPVAASSATNISSNIDPASGLNYDGVVTDNNLFLAWNGSDVATAIRATRIDTLLTQHNTVVRTGYKADLLTVTADNGVNAPNIYISWWDDTTNDGYTQVLDTNLQTILMPTKIIDNETITNLTVVANDDLETVYYEIPNSYSYDNAIPTNYIKTVTCEVDGTVGTPSILVRSVGLASKAFIKGDVIYFLSAYQSDNQKTYFLINEDGLVASSLAYSNGGGYRVTGLPGVTDLGADVAIAYNFTDLIVPVNKTQGAANSSGVYAQTGINLATFTFGVKALSVEIGSSLHLTGGFLYDYDGYQAVENNFFVYPDNVEVETDTSGGALADQTYFYQVVYEWSDNQGNIQRSAPSIPVTQVTAGGNTSSNTIHIPTLRLTYKTSNPIKIVVYRWSTGQQNYFQVTSVTDPLFNDTTVDSVDFVDTLADSAILGNSLIYTTGGVVENIAPPSFRAITLFDSRLFGLDSEDNNLLWFSKQVIEGTPVEMSDLFTRYIAPTISAQGSTGPNRCLAPMDDKLIIFKKDAMYYINGTGPDNVGTNSQYSEPNYISSTVGCANPQSIVFMPNGLMFQSDKGIWLLDRSLGTQYIGAPVEDYTQDALVTSAVNIPGTNQIRFNLDSGMTIMYDYYVGQWSAFTNVNAVSSVLFNDLHTYLNPNGIVLQETPGQYLDNGNPVLQSFTTSWIKAAGLLGYQRAYFMHLLGTYKSPHKLSIGIAYDYDSNPQQNTIVTPINYSGPWGSGYNWGSDAAWGGSTNIEKERVFFDRQKCESFQVIVNEVFDASFGTIAGEGLTLSGLNLTIGVKKAYPTLPAAKSYGS